MVLHSVHFFYSIIVICFWYVFYIRVKNTLAIRNINKKFDKISNLLSKMSNDLNDTSSTYDLPWDTKQLDREMKEILERNKPEKKNEDFN